MKKKVLSVLMCAAMVASFAGCGLKAPETPAANNTPAASSAAKADAPAADAGSTAAEPEVTLVYAEVNPLDTIVGQTASAFKEKVEELSGGKIAIDLQHSGVLGSENDVLDTMLGGGVIEVVLSPEEKQRFRQEMSEIYEKYCSDYMDIIEQIIAAGEMR